MFKTKSRWNKRKRLIKKIRAPFNKCMVCAKWNSTLFVWKATPILLTYKLRKKNMKKTKHTVPNIARHFERQPAQYGLRWFLSSRLMSRNAKKQWAEQSEIKKEVFVCVSLSGKQKRARVVEIAEWDTRKGKKSNVAPHRDVMLIHSLTLVFSSLHLVSTNK
jgi:hypothetical protein